MSVLVWFDRCATLFFSWRDWSAGYEHDLVRFLAAGHVHGDPPLRPQDDAARFPLHVLGRRPHGDDGPRALCECDRQGVVILCNGRLRDVVWCWPLP